MRFITAAFISVFWAQATFAQSCQPPTDTDMHCASPEFQACALRVNGAERTYCQHIPNQGGPLPLVMMFHGAGGNARQMVNLWRGHTEQSQILIAPAARETRFKGACSIRWRQIGLPAADWRDLDAADTCAGGTLADDLDFVDTLLTHISAQHAVSAAFAMGFSNGAGFTFQLYNTAQLAKRFNGFAAAGNGMLLAKLTALSKPAARYGPNTEYIRPFLFQMGTADKRNFAFEQIFAAMRSNPDCATGPMRLDAFYDCFIASQISGLPGIYDMPSTRRVTRDWLITFNNAQEFSQESLYPDLGHGDRPDDATITVREDYRRKASENSAQVSVLTTIDGGHDWPGWGGNHAPCPSRNCDVDLVREIIQFWRSHAGMRLPLP